MYTGHALDIEGFITIGDIIIGLAWWCHIWVRSNYDLKKNSFCSKDKHLFNSLFLYFDHS